MSYEYRHVRVERVIDGDTLTLTIDLGNHVKWTDNFRLMGVDTPERGSTGALLATDFVRDLLLDGVARVETHKPDKFGRWLVDVYVPGEHGGEVHLNRLLVTEGLAKEYFGGKKQ